jgi:hypothetical protein
LASLDLTGLEHFEERFQTLAKFEALRKAS